jgi:HAD superfamily hydrolase (TIGR01509 family)
MKEGGPATTTPRPLHPSRLLALVFDVDGTLVDSNDAHAWSWIDALREAGIAADFAAVRRLIGMGGDKLLPRVSGLSADSDAGKQILARRSEIFRDQYLRDVRPFPRSRELFQALAADGVGLAIASSAREDELALLLEIAEVGDLIAHRTSSSDVEASKPDPDVLHAALGRLGVAPASAALVGDTPYDRDAAHRGGSGFIGVRCGGWGDDDLAGARAIFDDPAEMMAARAWRAWR